MTDEQLDEIEAQINEFGEESGFILPLVKALREARAEVERLREAARQVHALASEVIVGDEVRAVLRMEEIHKITKGMVE